MIKYASLLPANHMAYSTSKTLKHLENATFLTWTLAIHCFQLGLSSLVRLSTALCSTESRERAQTLEPAENYRKTVTKQRNPRKLKQTSILTRNRCDTTMEDSLINMSRSRTSINSSHVYAKIISAFIRQLWGCPAFLFVGFNQFPLPAGGL